MSWKHLINAWRAVASHYERRAYAIQVRVTDRREADFSKEPPVEGSFGAEAGSLGSYSATRIVFQSKFARQNLGVVILQICAIVGDVQTIRHLFFSSRA